MDKLSLCLNFVPMLDDENPNASFMRESIDTYSDVMLDELIDEGFKDVLGSIGEKIKSGAKCVWKAAKSVADKIKVAFEHIGRGKSEKLDESIVALFKGVDGVHGKSGKDALNGIKIAYETISRNLSYYENIIDLAEKTMNSINDNTNLKKVAAAYYSEQQKIIRKHESMRMVTFKKFGIPTQSIDGKSISALAYADNLITGEAIADMNDKQRGEVKANGEKWLKEIRDRLAKIWERAIVKGCPLANLWRKVYEIDTEGYLDIIPSDLSSISNDFDYTKEDIAWFVYRVRLMSESKATNESVAPRNIMYRLGESEVYRTARSLDTVDGATLESNITRMVRDGHGFTFVSLNDLDKTVLYDIFEANQYFNVGVSGAKRAMKNLLGTGKVQMVFSDVCFIDVSIPYVVTMGRSPRVFVNISHFVSRNDQGKYEIKQPRNRNGFMAAIFAACVTYAILSHYHVLSPEIGDPIVLMYSYMLTDVIDRIVHADVITREKIRYLATEFALIQMYGTEAGNKQFQRFRTKFFPKLSPMIMDSIDAQFSLDAFDTLPKMIEELVRIYPSMKKLNFKQVWVNWQKKFGQATLFSIDYMGYMIYTMAMLLYESPLVYRLALDPMLKSARGESALKLLQTMVASVG